MIAPGWGMRVIEVAGLWGDGCWLAVMKLLVRLTGLTDAVPALPNTPGGAALTLVDGEEVEEAEVTMVLAGGEAYTQQDKFTGRGSTGAFSEEEWRAGRGTVCVVCVPELPLALVPSWV